MEYLDKILTASALLLTAFTSFYFKYKDLKIKEKNNISKNIINQTTTESKIIRSLEELKEELGADRVQVYDLHNGTHFASGADATKVSCTYEVLKPGIKSYQTDVLQHIHTSQMPNFFKDVLTKDLLEVKDIEDILTVYPGAYATKKSQSIKSFIDMKLVNKVGDPIGFLAVQYVEKKHTPLTDKDIKNLKRAKTLLEEYIKELT